MHRDLEDELTSAFSRSTSPGEQAALHAMVRETETQPHGRVRRQRGRGITALLTVGVLGLGGGTAAFAAPVVWDWLTFTPDASTTVTYPSGMTCEVAYVIRPGYINDAEEGEVTAFATEHLRTLDLSTLPVEKTLAELKANDLVVGDESPEELMQRALGTAISNDIAAAIEDEGLGVGEFALEGQARCE